MPMQAYQCNCLVLFFSSLSHFQVIFCTIFCNVEAIYILYIFDWLNTQHTRFNQNRDITGLFYSRYLTPPKNEKSHRQKLPFVGGLKKGTASFPYFACMAGKARQRQILPHMRGNIVKSLPIYKHVNLLQIQSVTQINSIFSGL